MVDQISPKFPFAISWMMMTITKMMMKWKYCIWWWNCRWWLQEIFWIWFWSFPRIQWMMKQLNWCNLILNTRITTDKMHRRLAVMFQDFANGRKPWLSTLASTKKFYHLRYPNIELCPWENLQNKLWYKNYYHGVHFIINYWLLCCQQCFWCCLCHVYSANCSGSASEWLIMEINLAILQWVCCKNAMLQSMVINFAFGKTVVYCCCLFCPIG